MHTDFTKQYINGSWVTGSSKKTIENTNPYNRESLGVIVSANQDDLDLAYQSANDYQKTWDAHSPGEKQYYLRRLYEVMQHNKDTIIHWLIQESGSSKLKAETEFNTASNIVFESASFPNRIHGSTAPSNTPGKENYTYRSAKGVIGMIGPWNFPFHLAMRSIAPAIATGNTVVVKPASDTPVTSGFLIAALFEEAGFPAGVLHVTAGRGSEIGDAFVTHPVPALLSFTGSTEVGTHIAELAAKHLKETALELGGNNAMVVLPDADVKKAAKAAVFGSYLHQGQICLALNRVIIHEDIYDEFVKEFTNVAKTIKSGNPEDEEVMVGPIINQEQVDNIHQLVQGTVDAGATLQTEFEINGNVIPPIVLSDVTNDMPAAKNEVFGPVSTLIKVSSEEEAIRTANDSPYGLSGSVFTQDRYHGMQVARQLNSGMVHVNDQSVNDEAHLPFGGEKQSGIGRFNGEWILEEFTTVQWVSVQAEDRPFPL
ncbi:aldehyde dehydrogenase family protein [Salibacterium salarium]|uniref:3-sulfolactaldehyde dehydrogenase n=1 Tax=Salibacterium salarium TaxID=284579 RepID=A0A3R9RFC6_9BACI|nr:aldehyde dehydrogenase family protein [Salibacterium salarium]RSL34166.1 aldehyde dehydrogenase family protein [Salibacterium salarium]